MFTFSGKFHISIEIKDRSKVKIKVEFVKRIKSSIVFFHILSYEQDIFRKRKSKFAISKYCKARTFTVNCSEFCPFVTKLHQLDFNEWIPECSRPAALPAPSALIRDESPIFWSVVAVHLTPLRLLLASKDYHSRSRPSTNELLQ